MKKRNISILAALLSIGAMAQTKTVNKGTMIVKAGTPVVTYFDFQNAEGAKVFNDGEFYFLGHYENFGDFTFTPNSKTGKVVFEGKNAEVQKIAGTSPSVFYNVLFNKSTQAVSGESFHLTNKINNFGEVNFNDGIVYMDKANGGAFVFAKNAVHKNVSDNSFVRGEVEKLEGNKNFSYPIGKSNYYRVAAIAAPSELADNYTGEYFLENSNALHAHTSKENKIKLINNAEYWTIKQDKNNDKDAVVVTLSWDERTTPEELLADKTKLRIVRWDEKLKKWIDEGGRVDESLKEVSSVAKVGGYGVFTLATLHDGATEIGKEGGVVVYNGVTPNGDGLNDYFIIEGINKYANKVSIYNRWGREVFQTDNYDTVGNVFDGVVNVDTPVLRKGERLPSGTYYYIAEYVSPEEGGKKIVLKGYLHLENNK